jgi:hypothetical protein
MNATEREALRARRFGWTSLFVWAAFGLFLEGAQGFRLAPFTMDELARTLVRLGHAHGVGLSLVVLVYASNGTPLLTHRDDGGASTGRLLRIAAMLVPAGFALSAIGHPEGDPNLAVLAVPLGALLLLAALASLAFAAWKKR